MLRINWVSSLLASLALWTFIVWNLSDGGSNDDAHRSMSWVTTNWTWFYIVTQDLWFMFILWILFTKYKDVKLGRDDEEPAFSDYEWFSMLFACGIGVGLYKFGVAEPMYYYRGVDYAYLPNKIPIVNDDQKAQQAIFLTLFHWGLHGWIPYVLVAMTLGVVCYRNGKPMTIRYAFYPLLGENVNGLLGDCIDALSIATTTFGVCTSLGLGVDTIINAMARLNHNVDVTSETTKILIIWVITAVACTSVVLGLKNGIRVLSKVTFGIGLIFLAGLYAADSPFFLLNSFVQSFGYYMQWVTQVGWDCDTWPMLTAVLTGDTTWKGHTWKDLTWGKTSSTDAIADAINAAGGSGLTEAQRIEMWGERTSDKFMDDWTIFYWGWWISWAPFVGMFIARISRGRTIGQMIKGAFIAPITFGFFYLTTLGSLGIKMQRVAELALGDENSVQWNSLAASAKTGDDGVISYSNVVNCTDMGYDGSSPSSAAAKALAEHGYYALACRGADDQILDLVEPYGKLATLFKLMILVAVILYFITSSDSGSYVDDLISANGYENPPVLQKIYWACTEGALATALLVGGDLKMVRGVSIVAGFPFTMALNFMAISLWRALKEELGDVEMKQKRKGFNTCIWDFLEAYNPETATASAPDAKTRVIAFVKSFVFPFDAVKKVKVAVGTEEKVAMLNGAVVTGLLWTWFGCLCATGTGYNTTTIAWTMYFIMIFCIASMRRELREKRNVIGNWFEDYCCAAAYPFALAQLEHEAENDSKLA